MSPTKVQIQLGPDACRPDSEQDIPAAVSLPKCILFGILTVRRCILLQAQ